MAAVCQLIPLRLRKVIQKMICMFLSCSILRTKTPHSTTKCVSISMCDDAFALFQLSLQSLRCGYSHLPLPTVVPDVLPLVGEISRQTKDNHHPMCILIRWFVFIRQAKGAPICLPMVTSASPQQMASRAPIG